MPAPAGPVPPPALTALAIYVTLTPGDGAVGGERLKTMARLRQLIPAAETSLDTLTLSPATLYMRMHRDLLGDAASQYLPHLLPQ